MANKFTDAVFETRQVSGLDKFVLWALAWHTNKDTGEAWPSTGLLAEECGISERKVQYSLGIAAGRGLITKTGTQPCKHMSGRYTNKWKINLEALKWQGEDDGCTPCTGAQDASVQDMREMGARRAADGCTVCPQTRQENTSASPSAQNTSLLASSLVSSAPSSADASSGATSSSASRSGWTGEATQQVRDILMTAFGVSDPYAMPDSKVLPVMDELSRHFDPESETGQVWLESALAWGLSHKKFWADRLVDPEALARALANEDAKGFAAQYNKTAELAKRKAEAKDFRPEYKKRTGHWNMGEDDPPRSAAPSQTCECGSTKGICQDCRYCSNCCACPSPLPHAKGFEVMTEEQIKKELAS
jgi:hypothetical protein